MHDHARRGDRDIADFRPQRGDVADFKALLLGGPKFGDDVTDVFAKIEAERKADIGRAVDFETGTQPV